MSSKLPHKELGKEYPLANEKEIINEMISLMKSQVDRVYEDKKMLRQIHTKSHGLVKAKFEVIKDLPESLKVGVFKEAKTFDAWIRYSNGQSARKSDGKGDVRGMAIKLLGVDGDKLLSGDLEENTHDFLLMNSETFFCKTLEDLKDCMKAVTSKYKIKIPLFFLNPFNLSTTKRLFKSFVKCDNLFELDYFSTVPFRFGGKDTAVKYKVVPHSSNKLVNTNTEDEDFLKINLAETLKSNSIGFDFFIQRQLDAETMPIEDLTVPWTSEFVKVATIQIPQQEFDSNEQMEYGEDMSFNAWHALPEHQPLGAFSRARKVAYEAMVEYRHAKNNVSYKEPVKTEDINEYKMTNTSEIPTEKILTRKAKVKIKCDDATAFEFIASGEKLPSWLKKSGAIPGASGVEVTEGPYNKGGAKRNVKFENGDTVKEELLSVNSPGNYSYQVTEFSNFFRFLTDSAYSTIWFDNKKDDTEVTWSYSFTYKNIFARMFLSLFLSVAYKKFMRKNLANAKLVLES